MTKVPMISIVDDDESVREATRGLIRSLGFEAVTFATAEDFLSSDRVHETSCLITDVQMPGLSGVELQSHLIAQGNRYADYLHYCIPRGANARTRDEGRSDWLFEQTVRRAMLYRSSLCGAQDRVAGLIRDGQDPNTGI